MAHPHPTVCFFLTEFPQRRARKGSAAAGAAWIGEPFLVESPSLKQSLPLTAWR